MTEQPDQPARTAVYSELMWPEWNQTSESYGAGEDKTNALLDAHAAEVRAAALPAPVDRRRTTWPSAVELQKAADILREVAPQIEGRLAGLADPVADWLDETANALSWLAPYRDNEPGYGMWETAMVVARKILGITAGQPTPCGPVPDACDAEAGDPCANHEREQAHEEGEHAFCGPECTTAGQQETEAPEVYPTEVSYIGEIEESDGFWMYLTADRDRAAVEKRIASRQKQFPTWADGRPVRCRIVRKTTTYTVEPTL